MVVLILLVSFLIVLLSLIWYSLACYFGAKKVFFAIFIITSTIVITLEILSMQPTTEEIIRDKLHRRTIGVS